MWHKQKVSVIVPVYKVEPYIHRCIDSVLQQTYANIEVILVDDGSPDNCGEIIDAYEDDDNRVMALHKKNGGLSDARNFGMQHATGEFTMFVDSDDWLDKHMIELMVTNSLTYQADVVQSAFYYAYDNRLLIDRRHYREVDPPVKLDNWVLMHELVVNNKVKNFAWGKLYKTELIRDIPFEKGVLFEDVFWAHHVMHRVKRFILMHKPLYYYYQRDDSIVSSYTPKNLDIIKGLQVRHRFIEKYYKELTGESYKSLLKMCFSHYNLLFLNRKQDQQKKHRKAIQQYVISHKQPLRAAVQHDRQLRRQLHLFLLHPYCYIGYHGFRKMLRKMNVLSAPAGLTRVEKGGLI